MTQYDNSSKPSLNSEFEVMKGQLCFENFWKVSICRPTFAKIYFCCS